MYHHRRPPHYNEKYIFGTLFPENLKDHKQRLPLQPFHQWSQSSWRTVEPIRRAGTKLSEGRSELGKTESEIDSDEDVASISGTSVHAQVDLDEGTARAMLVRIDPEMVHHFSALRSWGLSLSGADDD